MIHNEQGMLSLDDWFLFTLVLAVTDIGLVQWSDGLAKGLRILAEGSGGLAEG